MMFNCNEREKVGGTVWRDLSEAKDHIVPHPMETEEDSLFAGGEYANNKRVEDLTSDVRCTVESSFQTNYRSNGSSSFQTNKELSSSQIEIDSWLNFPPLWLEPEDDYIDGNDNNSVMELMNDLTGATNLIAIRGDLMQLDRESDLFGREDSKENDVLLECDWATFGDFDDFDKLFRKNDSICGHDMIGDADGLLSASKDVIDSTAQSIPMPDLPSCKNQTPDEGCSSFQSDDHTGKQRSLLHKEKVDGLKIIPRSQSKAEKRKKIKPSRNLKDIHNQNQNNASISIQSSTTTPRQAFKSKAITQEMQLDDVKLMRECGSSNQIAFSDHEYPTNCFPGIQLSTNAHIDRNQKRPPSTYNTKHPKTSNRLPESTLGTMTAQDNMEKLRRLQQMQAQLAIEKKQQQYNQLSDADISAPQSSTFTYEFPSEVVIYCQLQDIIEKLDINTRLCIRDSLFRLARSVMERQSASDRSSTNKSNKDEHEVSADEESRNHDRSSMLENPETDTNPIDRIAANLLFQRTTEAYPRLGSYDLLSST